MSGDGATPATSALKVASPIVPRMAVRWRDLDHLGHVNSVVFLTYLDEGRTAWLSAVLGPTFLPEQYVVAHVDLDYRAEIAAGTSMVETHHTIEAIGRSSITFREELRIVGGEAVAHGGVVIVMWEPSLHHSRPLTETERAALVAAAP